MEMIENITFNEDLVLGGLINNVSKSPTYVQINNTDNPYLSTGNFSANTIYDDPSLDFPQNISTLTNESTASIYETFMDDSRHWVQKVLVPLVMCFGVVGNSVSMVVLTRRKMRSSTNSYLTALAISDLLYLIFVFFLSLKHHPDMQHPSHWLYWHYVRYALWLTDASRPGSCDKETQWTLHHSHFTY
ncbi:uncharacterized protein [Palaemon carinicauda]|uniref:uncharacterized protein n=1 Tax=Palaemon carinicauda TaxID=392227 RepID=UPI0035B59879